MYSNEDVNWYLVQCKPRQDERAEQNLSNQGFVCYRPNQQVQRIRHGKRAQLCESLFPGYLFIQLDHINQNWSSIRSTRGVNRLVGFGGMPMPVHDAIIEGLRGREQQRPCSGLQRGDRVRITEGPFRELEAIYMKDDGDERVVLLLNMLQRQQRLSFPLTSIRPELQRQAST